MDDRNEADHLESDDEKVTFSNWTNTSDFLARQIVDDLTRAGLNALYYQHIVEQTLLKWVKTGRTWGK